MGQATLVHEGNIIDYTPTVAAVAAGDVVLQDVTYGIAVRPIPINTLGSIQLGGVYDVDHIADIIAAGAAVYWDPTGTPVGGGATGGATGTAGALKFMGWCVTAVGATDALVRVKLFGSPAVTANYYGPLSLAIADPGDAGAIAVTTGGYVPLVSGAAAETRTLAAPTIIGQQMLLYMKTDGGGDIAVTAATTINEAGNNTITFANPGEACHLIACEEDATLRWRFAHVDGAVLSTA